MILGLAIYMEEDVDYWLAADCWEGRKMLGGVANQSDVERGGAIDASGIGPFDNPFIATLNFQGASKNSKLPRWFDEVWGGYCIKDLGKDRAMVWHWFCGTSYVDLSSRVGGGGRLGVLQAQGMNMILLT